VNLIFLKVANDVWLELETTVNKIGALILTFLTNPLLWNLPYEVKLINDITDEINKLPSNIFLRVAASGFVIPKEWNSHVIKLDDAFYLFLDEMKEVLLSFQVGSTTQRRMLWQANYSGFIARWKDYFIKLEASSTVAWSGSGVLRFVKFFASGPLKQVQLLYQLLTALVNGTIVFASVAILYTFFVGLDKDKWLKESLSQKHKRVRLKDVDIRKRV